MAKHSIVVKIADGISNQYAISFTGGFMSRDHVTARVNNEVDGLGNPSYRQITWVNDGIVQVGGALPASGVEVEFRRTTPIDQPVNDFQNGAVLLDQALDEGFEQAIKRLQEVEDTTDNLQNTEEMLEQAVQFNTEASGHADRAEAAGLALSEQALVASQQRLACELDVGNYLNGVDTEAFLNAQRPHQDFTIIGALGSEELLMSIAAEGSVYQTDERVRICTFDWVDDGRTLSHTGFTGLLNIGHGQGFKGLVLDGTQYIYTTSKVTDAANPQKGFSRITWNGTATNDSDVETFILFGDEGSGHIFENLYRAMPTVSDDGKWLIIHAELKEKSDNNGMVLVYDRAEVEAAADPKTVSPQYKWRTQNPPWHNAWVKQGIVWDSAAERIKIAYSGSKVEDPKFIETYPITGATYMREMVSGNLDLYGVDGVLSDATKGPMVQAEIEGLEMYQGRLFFGFVTAFVDNTDIVSATINGNAIKLAACVDVPAGKEAWDQDYWTRTKLPATAGVHNKNSTYSRGLNKTEKGKFIWEYGPVDDRTDWLPVTVDFYGLSGNERQSAGNGLDYAVHITEALNVGFYSTLGGKDGIPFLSQTFLPGESRTLDVRSDTEDTAAYAVVRKRTSPTDKYAEFAGPGGSLRLYDPSDPSFGGQVVLEGANGVGLCMGRELVQNDTLLVLHPVGTTGVLNIWNGQDAAVGGAKAEIYFDVAGTLNCTKLSGSTFYTTSTGVLTDGDGADGVVTVSAAPDGLIYVSVRLPGNYARHIAWDVRFARSI